VKIDIDKISTKSLNMAAAHIQLRRGPPDDEEG